MSLNLNIASRSALRLPKVIYIFQILLIILLFVHPIQILLRLHRTTCQHLVIFLVKADVLTTNVYVITGVVQTVAT